MIELEGSMNYRTGGSQSEQHLKTTWGTSQRSSTLRVGSHSNQKSEDGSRTRISFKSSHDNSNVQPALRPIDVDSILLKFYMTGNL